jgi:isopentenyldiphosphate isomerase
VLQDLIRDFELTRRHAIVEWAQSLAQSHPLIGEADQLRAFRTVCEELGIHTPTNLEALLVLTDRYKAGDNLGSS